MLWTELKLNTACCVNQVSSLLLSGQMPSYMARFSCSSSSSKHSNQTCEPNPWNCGLFSTLMLSCREMKKKHASATLKKIRNAFQLPLLRQNLSSSCKRRSIKCDKGGLLVFLQSNPLLLVVLVNNSASSLCIVAPWKQGDGGRINNSLTFHVKIVNNASGSRVGGRGKNRAVEVHLEEGGWTFRKVSWVQTVRCSDNNGPQKKNYQWLGNNNTKKK